MNEYGTLDFAKEHFSEGFMREWNRKRFCMRCGSVLRYDSLGEYRCMNCGRTELDDYGKVRQYLEENGPSPLRMIAAGTDVPSIIIEELLEMGKIEVAENDRSFLQCSVCGKPIKSGKICSSCASKQINDLRNAYARCFVGEEVQEKKEKPKSKKKSVRKPQMYTRMKKIVE